MDLIEYFRFRAMDQNGTGSLSIILICFLAGLVLEYLNESRYLYNMQHRRYR